MRDITKIILHCSASDDPAQDAEMIDQWHRQRGFREIGYQYFITPSGQLQVGRPEKDAGAHCRGHNADSIGICVAGLTAFNHEQFYTLSGLLRDLAKAYPQATLHGHREFNEHKSCPVFDYSEFVSDWNYWTKRTERPWTCKPLWTLLKKLRKLLKLS